MDPDLCRYWQDVDRAYLASLQDQARHHLSRLAAESGRRRPAPIPRQAPISGQWRPGNRPFNRSRCA